MSVKQTSKHELVTALRERYWAASRAERGQVLDMVVEATGWICGKRLAPFLSALVPALEREGARHLSAAGQEALLGISAATIDRRLARLHKETKPAGMGTTKPGSLSKRQIPIKTYTPWNEQEAAFVRSIWWRIAGPRPPGATSRRWMSPMWPPAGRSVSPSPIETRRACGQPWKRCGNASPFRARGLTRIMARSSSMGICSGTAPRSSSPSRVVGRITRTIRRTSNRRTGVWCAS